MKLEAPATRSYSAASPVAHSGPRAAPDGRIAPAARVPDRGPASHPPRGPSLSDLVQRPRRARLQLRHGFLIASFALAVALPLMAIAAYLWLIARDQYESRAAFTIRAETPLAAGMAALAPLAAFGKAGGASDGDILFDFIRSQQMMRLADARLGLDALYRRTDGDWFFALPDAASIDEKLDFWRATVDVTYDSSTSIVEIAARAFAPDDARRIVEVVLLESSGLVNDLSDQARADAIRNAMADLSDAEANLKLQRRKLADFRRDNRMVDPQADMTGQAGVVGALQVQLAQAMVERDMLLTYADPTDQRVKQADRRIAAIRARIGDERGSLGAGAPTDAPAAEILGRYEELKVDLEFANTAYTQSLASLSASRAEARRQARYVVAHVAPTEAAESRFPRRGLILGLSALTLLLAWGIAVVLSYNLRDRR